MILLELVLILSVFYILLFLTSIKIKDNSIVDVFWGIGFVIIALYSLVAGGNYYLSQIITTMLVICWGVRLFVHIGIRRLKKGEEDRRYAEWRRSWKHFYLRSFFQVYLLQMIFMLIISTPIIIINSSNFDGLGLVLIGGLIAILGLVIESTADAQLGEFIRHKKPGDVYTRGLYSISRHPNYFGESLFWLGISVTSLIMSPLGIVGFITITFLVRYVSGVPILEKHYKGNKKFQKYSEKVNIFIPWFPRGNIEVI